MANIDFAFVSCICMKGLSVLFAQAGAHECCPGAAMELGCCFACLHSSVPHQKVKNVETDV